MSQQIIKSEIDSLLEVIKEQWDTIKEYEDKIPYIELDILMSNVRKLYEDLSIIDKLNKVPGITTQQIRDKIVRETAIRFEPELRRPGSRVAEPEAATPVQTPPPPPPPSPKPEPEPEPEIKIPPKTETIYPIFRPSPIAEPENQQIKETVTPPPAYDRPPRQETIRATAVVEPRTEEKAPTPKTIADKFIDERKSVNEKLFEVNGDTTLGSRIQAPPVTDLKAAIGINDKFLFINELFRGDLTTYNQTIARLNTMGSQAEALEELHELCMKHRWNEHTAPLLRFKEILKRRYPE